MSSRYPRLRAERLESDLRKVAYEDGSCAAILRCTEHSERLARLFAHAPELYEALRRAQARVEDILARYHQARPSSEKDALMGLLYNVLSPALSALAPPPEGSAGEEGLIGTIRSAMVSDLRQAYELLYALRLRACDAHAAVYRAMRESPQAAWEACQDEGYLHQAIHSILALPPGGAEAIDLDAEVERHIAALGERALRAERERDEALARLAQYGPSTTTPPPEAEGAPEPAPEATPAATATPGESTPGAAGEECRVEGCGREAIPRPGGYRYCCATHDREFGPEWSFCQEDECWQRVPPIGSAPPRRCSRHGGQDYTPYPCAHCSQPAEMGARYCWDHMFWGENGRTGAACAVRACARSITAQVVGCGLCDPCRDARRSSSLPMEDWLISYTPSPRAPEPYRCEACGEREAAAGARYCRGMCGMRHGLCFRRNCPNRRRTLGSLCQPCETARDRAEMSIGDWLSSLPTPAPRCEACGGEALEGSRYCGDCTHSHTGTLCYVRGCPGARQDACSLFCRAHHGGWCIAPEESPIDYLARIGSQPPPAPVGETIEVVAARPVRAGQIVAGSDVQTIEDFRQICSLCGCYVPPGWEYCAQHVHRCPTCDTPATCARTFSGGVRSFSCDTHCGHNRGCGPYGPRLATPAQPSSLPVPRALTTHGATPDVDPRAMEAALVGAGVPGQEAPWELSLSLQDDCNFYDQERGQSCFQRRSPGSPFCAAHHRQGLLALAQERAGAEQGPVTEAEALTFWEQVGAQPEHPTCHRGDCSAPRALPSIFCETHREVR